MSVNPYTTKTQARIHHRDIENILHTESYIAAASIAALERQRGWQAEAEVNSLLKQHGVTPYPSIPLISMLRQALGTALVRVGERLSGAPARGASPAMTPEAGTLQTGV